MLLIYPDRLGGFTLFKKFFHYIILIIALLLLIIIIFRPSKSQDDTASEKPLKTPSATEEPIELITWTDLNGFDEFEQSYIDLFNSLYTDYQIKAVARPGDLDTDTMTAMMNGSAPDILILSYDEVTTYAYLDALLPLDEYFSHWEDFSNMNHDSVEKFKINDHYYGLPCGEYTMSLLYNKQIFRANNLVPPKEGWTWNDFLSLASSLHDPSTGQYGFALNWNQWGNWWFQMFVWAAGGDLTSVDPDGKLVTDFTNEGVIKAANYYRKLKKQNCIQPNNSLRLDDLKKDFADGKAAMIYSGLDALYDFTSLGMNPNDIGILPIPIGPGGSNAAQIGGSCYVIHSNVPEEKREGVFRFYKLISSKQYFEDKANYFSKNNTPFLQGQLRTDINYNQLLQNIPAEFINTMKQSSQTGRASYYGTPVVSSFIDSAIQRIMLDSTVNIETVFRQYENEANNQAVPQYNEAF